MASAKRHHRLLSGLAFGLLALVVELGGRSLTSTIDVGKHVANPGNSQADYYPILLAAVKVGVALLLARLVWRDVTVRYKQTFLGIAWALLVPAFTAFVYIIVFGKFAKFPRGGQPYPSLVIAGVIPMQYFASGLTSSSTSLVSNLPLVTKVYFPRVLLPLAGVLVPLVDLLVGLPVLIGLMAFYGTWPSGATVVFAPLFILLGTITALGAGFLLSAVNVRYRDVPYMIPVFLQVLPLVSGVMYAVSQPEHVNVNEILVRPTAQQG